MTLKALSAAFGFGFLGICIACGSDDKSGQCKQGEFSQGCNLTGNGGATGTGSQPGTGSFIAVGGSSNDNGGYINGTGNSTGNGGAMPTCGTGVYAAESLPVDMYMMFDQSTSMGDPIPNANPPSDWWTPAVAAVKSFVVNPAVQNMGLGIQYFGLNGIAPGSCDIAQYATPEVEIAPLSTNSGAIIASIGTHSPASFTPTEPALQGALDHMAVWAPAHPGRAPAVVLVTDGFPSECDIPSNLGTAPSITDIVTRAATAYAGPYKIRTFVIGFLNGPGVSNLNQVAQAGGTKAAFLIDPAAGDIGTQFTNAMLSISNTTLQCDFPLPAPPSDAQTLDPNTVRMYYTPNATQVETEIPWLDNSVLCASHGNNGWFYDAGDPANATRILVCQGTCESFAAGVVKIGAGCMDNTPIK